MATSIGIEPLADRIVILPTEQKEEVSASGIIVATAADAKEKALQGTVVAVGPGLLVDGVRVPLSVAVGDTVLCARYGYEELSVGGQKYFIIAESNVLAVIK